MKGERDGHKKAAALYREKWEAAEVALADMLRAKLELRGSEK